MSREKFAFHFAGRAGKGMSAAGASFSGAGHVVMMAIDAGVALVDATCAFLNYRQEKEITRQVARQAELMKRQLDEAVEEAKRRVKIEVEETYKRLLLDLEREEALLKQNLDWMRGRLEARLRQTERRHEEVMAVFEIEERARRPLRRVMETTVACLEEARQAGVDFAVVAQLEEEYRLCATRYDEMIRITTRRNQA